MKKIVNLLGYEGLKIIIDPSILNFSTDSTILADFVTIKQKDKNIVDLGTGTGYIPLYLTLRTNTKIYGIEIQKDIYDMFVESVKLNNLEEQIIPIHDDMKNIKKHFLPSSFDVVLTNPPYFKEQLNINNNEYKSIARHEIKITFEEIAAIAKYLLKDGGTFSLVHIPERLFELVEILKKNNLEPTRIRYVYSTINKDEAELVLIETRKNGKPNQLKILQPLYITDENNQSTEELLKVYNFKGETNEKTKDELK